MAISEHVKKKIDKMRPNFPTTQALVIPILHEIQHELGWVSAQSMKDAAEFLGLPLMKIKEVATFYTMFNLKPVGKVHYQLCTNIGCWLGGSEKLLQTMEKQLGIQAGQTTKDGKYTLSRVECLGACGSGPVLQVNEDYHEYLDEVKLTDLLKKVDQDLESGKPNVGKSTYNPEVWP